MPRKKKETTPTDQTSPTLSGVQTADIAPSAAIGGDDIDTAVGPTEPGQESSTSEGRNWGNPYKALVTTAEFSMGEDRRFKQRVFKFKDRPADNTITVLKENGFTYRPNEKSWTVPATPSNRILSDDLARQFAGKSMGEDRDMGMSR